jgi:4-hydroxybenzoate polyprenyltransferase
MRGAGCVWNDIIDRDLDKKVARTASRGRWRAGG